jgi:predicted aspartyl protease
LRNVLRTTDVGIANNQALGRQQAVQGYSAIWDTGATNTGVTPRVVSECGLVPIGQTQVVGVHGEELSNVYLIDVYLPNSVIVREITASEVPGLTSRLDDILIGMDIIGLGAFAVSNYRGKTTFTFRMPSVEEIDFVSSSRGLM